MQYREGNRAHPFWAAHPQRDTPRVLDVAEDCRDHSEPGVTHTVQLSRLYAIGHAPTDPPEASGFGGGGDRESPVVHLCTASPPLRST